MDFPVYKRVSAACYITIFGRSVSAYWRGVCSNKPDVVHHLIGGMDWMPAGLSLCPGPFVWGPVGSEDTHPVILRHQLEIAPEGQGACKIRWALRTLDPFTRWTAARADVLSHTPETLPSFGIKVIRSRRPALMISVSPSPKRICCAGTSQADLCG